MEGICNLSQLVFDSTMLIDEFYDIITVRTGLITSL